MIENPDPIKALMGIHIGLVDELGLLKITIDRLKKRFSPHLLEALKREILSFLKSMEQHIRFEEESLFPVLEVALGNKREQIISMARDHSNLKEEIERLRTLITNLQIENLEECRKIINLAETIIASLTDLFTKHVNNEENHLYRLAKEALLEKELVEIERRMQSIEK
jgi:hemerythrin-like domain-containing protein